VVPAGKSTIVTEAAKVVMGYFSGRDDYQEERASDIHEISTREAD